MTHVALYPQDGLNLISLCTGGGGLDLGVELAIPSARAVCMVEREAFAVARLVSAMEAGLLAPAAVWSDARSLDGRRWRGIVDGVIGGIPCQPHSLAGKRLAGRDERDLWSAARRIIVQSRAWFVLIENVGGMLSSGGGERVWRDLRRLGYQVEAGLFAAAEVGASHQRERLFILAVDDPDRRHGKFSARWRPGSGGPESSGASSQSQGSSGRLLQDVADAHGSRPPVDPRQPGVDAEECPAPERIGGAVADAASVRRREGRPEPGFRDRIPPAASTRGAVEDAACEGRQPISIRPGQQDETKPDAARPGLFPPGPGDLDAWRSVLQRSPHLEPAIRRMAHGVATRVDELRMLGNGVVPLVAAYALRTLVTRLASRGSAGAAFLARLMDAEQ